MALASAGGGVRFNVTEWLSGVVEVVVPFMGEVAAEELNQDGSGEDVRVFGSLATTF
jgi:hypothetical protein